MMSVSQEVLRASPVFQCASFTRQQRFAPLLACVCILSCWHGLGNVQSVAARPVLEGAAQFPVSGELVATGIMSRQIQELEFLPATKSAMQGAISEPCGNGGIAR